MVLNCIYIYMAMTILYIIYLGWYYNIVSYTKREQVQFIKSPKQKNIYLRVHGATSELYI